MTWERVGPRLSDTPLVLAGPLLRKCDVNRVSVWIALRRRRLVRLKVFDRDPVAGAEPLVEVEEFTLSLGEHLHIVTVSAKLENEDLLERAKVYLYELEFELEGEPTEDLFSPGVLVSRAIAVEPEAARLAAQKLLTYQVPGAPSLPSFSLPPNDLNDLKIVHGSCRMPHGEGVDVLEAVDIMIGNSFTSGNARPHLLFLTGDQVYLDVNSPAMLAVLTDIGDTLCFSEMLPGVNKRNTELLPNQRAEVTQEYAGHKEYSANHAFSFGEIAASYLMQWSDVLWPSPLPNFEDIYPDEPHMVEVSKPYPYGGESRPAMSPLYSGFLAQIRRLVAFKKRLPKVRRALANVPTYMIFDDHEVTDDWYLTLAWTRDVWSKVLGRRLLLNSLANYLVFQHWGNAPSAFEPGSVGREALGRVRDFVGSKGEDEDAVAGLEHDFSIKAAQDVVRDRRVSHTKTGLDWDYTVSGPHFVAIVLDVRTLRAFPDSADDAAVQMSDEQLKIRIGHVATDPDSITIIVSPTPIRKAPMWVGKWGQRADYALGWVKSLAKQRLTGHVTKAYGPDTGDAWSHQPRSVDQLLGRLAAAAPTGRFVFLSGDLHYAYTTRLEYWATRPYLGGEHSEESGAEHRAVFAQLLSSGLCRENSIKRNLHRLGYQYLRLGPIVQSDILNWVFDLRRVFDDEEIVGWHQPPKVEGFVPGLFGSWVPSELRQSPARWKIEPVPVEKIDSPHWRYRVEYIKAEAALRGAPPDTLVGAEVPADSDGFKKERKLVAEAHQKYSTEKGVGLEIVGKNNLGEVTFEWNDNKKGVIHTMWWRLTDSTDPLPLSKFYVSLDLDGEKPLVPGES